MGGIDWPDPVEPELDRLKRENKELRRFMNVAIKTVGGITIEDVDIRETAEDYGRIEVYVDVTAHSRTYRWVPWDKKTPTFVTLLKKNYTI